MYQASGLDRSKLLTMYDLPSEEVGDPGLPDEFHRLQADLMEKTCQSEILPAAIVTGKQIGRAHV